MWDKHLFLCKNCNCVFEYEHPEMWRVPEIEVRCSICNFVWTIGYYKEE